MGLSTNFWYRPSKKKGEFIKYETKYADGGYGNIHENQNKNDTLMSSMNAKTVHNLRFRRKLD